MMKMASPAVTEDVTMSSPEKMKHEEYDIFRDTEASDVKMTDGSTATFGSLFGSDPSRGDLFEPDFPDEIPILNPSMYSGGTMRKSSSGDKFQAIIQ